MTGLLSLFFFFIIFNKNWESGPKLFLDNQLKKILDLFQCY